MYTKTITYPSRDGASTIHALQWEPDAVHAGDTPPRGVVQIVHGMSEHVERYTPFASYLCKKGFAVCANDHIGHGGSVSCEADLGHMPRRGGEDVLVEDVHELRSRYARDLTERFPGQQIPYVIFGHSMGSFVTRVYLTRHAFDVRAAIICGTGQQSVAMAVGGKVATGLIATVRGERYRSKFADSLGAGGYAKAVENPRTPLDWLSTDERVVDEYIADPRCGQMFTVGAYSTLASLVKDAISPTLAKSIPKSLPMFFIAGDRDPVGDCGRGVEAAAREYRDAGVERVDCKLYHGARHEILNDRVRDEVQDDIEHWLADLGI